MQRVKVPHIIADKYRVYEVGGEIVIEYWRDWELSVKLIHAKRALMLHYNAEMVALVKCSSVS
jgi:hypothetical protein